MKKLMMTMALVAMTFAGRATEVWTLDDSAAMPGSFWTITSPDGRWKLTCVPTDGSVMVYDCECKADLAVVDYYDSWGRRVETEDVFGSSVGGGFVVKGSGVLRLPVYARNRSGGLCTVEIGGWPLHAARNITKCIVPVDYLTEIGQAALVFSDFEVEDGNPKYYARDGVLYLRERYREDGRRGDVLRQVSCGKRGVFTIPDGVTRVEADAIGGCNLSEVVIGSDLMEFEESDVGRSLKKITIRDNLHFKYADGLLLGDEGATISLALPGVIASKTINVPSSVRLVPEYSMAFLADGASLVFSSSELLVEDEAFEESDFARLDFSAVGTLKLTSLAFEDLNEDGRPIKVYFPKNVKFVNRGTLRFDEDDSLTDIFWPTDKSFEDSGLLRIDTPHSIRLHLLRTAGDWSGFNSSRVKVVKDMVEPAEPETPAFFAAGTRVGVKVSDVLTVADYASLKVTGLPSGISVAYDKKGHATFSGAAKKDGTYQVVVSYAENGRTVSRVYPLFVDKAPHLALTLVAGTNGTVKGGGDIYVGKKATATATAAKNCVFAGWYVDEERETPYASDVDFRTPKLTVANEQADDASLTLYAKFIPVAEDWATVGCEIADEYVTKQAIEPVSVAFDGGSLPTVKVTGLPSGLKFTTKLVTSKVTTGTGKDRVTTLVTNALPYQIYGTPTKSGIFNAKVTVTTAGKATATKDLVFTVLDRAKGERVLRIAYDASAGKATGAGIYAADKKVTLKATAAKNCVFAGWYADSSCTEALAGSVDHRTPSFPYVMPVGDTTVWAKFMPTTEDTGITLAIDGNEVTSAAADTVFNTAGELTLALDVESVSVPKVTVSGLPSGLKFTAKEVLNKDKTVLAEANTIYGTATKPGTYVVTAKLTNTTVKKAIEKKFTIVVDNLTGANDCFREPLRNGRGEKYVISAGVMEYDDVPSLMLKAVGSLKVSGLPSGMKYNAGKGCLEGRVTKAGTYTVSLTVNGKTSTFTLEVQPLPEWVVGSFEAYLAHEENLSTRDVITISSSGDVSVKRSDAWTFYDKIYVDNDRFAVRMRMADGSFLLEYNDSGHDGNATWNEHFLRHIHPIEVEGVVLGVVEGDGEEWGQEGDGREWHEELRMFGVQNVWSRAAGTALCPAIGEGTQVELDMSDWTERGWNYQDGNYDLDGCFLVLTYGKNGNMSVAFFENGAAKASATAGTVLVPYELSADGKTLNALASVVLAPRGRHAISLALYFNIDVSAGVVYGSDFSLDHYYMENQ